MKTILIVLLSALPCLAGCIANPADLPFGLTGQPQPTAATAAEDSTGAILNPLAHLDVYAEESPAKAGPSTEIGRTERIVAFALGIPETPDVDLNSSGDFANAGGVLTLHSAGLSVFEIVGYELSNPWLSGGGLAGTALLIMVIAWYRRVSDAEPPPL